MILSEGCYICIDPFDIQTRCPIVLSCGHTFCQKCVSWINSSCPTCRSEVTSWNKNYLIMDHLETQEGPVKCIIDEHIGSHQLDRFCTNCQKAACGVCVCRHAKEDPQSIITLEEFKKMAKPLVSQANDHMSKVTSTLHSEKESFIKELQSFTEKYIEGVKLRLKEQVQKVRAYGPDIKGMETADPEKMEDLVKIYRMYNNGTLKEFEKRLEVLPGLQSQFLQSLQAKNYIKGDLEMFNKCNMPNARKANPIEKVPEYVEKLREMAKSLEVSYESQKVPEDETALLLGPYMLKKKGDNEGNCNGDVYIGQWKDGKMHGRGELYSEDMSCYVGEWKGGRSNGLGKAIYLGKDRYTGEFMNDMKHGKGEYVWRNGSKYVGEWVNDKEEGEGELINPDGSWYKGGWKASMRHGKGEFVGKSGVRYVGDWVNNKEEGHGEVSYVDGSAYTGRWRAGRKHGRGVGTGVNGRKREEVWDRGVRLD